jgi:RNA polymerase sigma-70 factor (ECF subfamily)
VPDWLSRLWDEHADAVLAYALRRADRATAEEAVVDTFTVAWRRRQSVPDDPRPWLLGVCRNVLRSRSRGEARHRRRLGAALDRSLATGVPEATSETERVRRALDRLRPADREVLVLTAWDGLTPAEAASVLGCSRGALDVRLHRARRRLRHALTEGAVR